MANFSVELRTIVEAGVNIFGFPYDFYDESKRAEFEKAFIRHFYFREIGCETTERFRWYLEDKMRTVFPYYNELFKAAQIEYNILDNYNVTEEYEIRRKGLDKENNVSSSVGRASDNQSSETTEYRDGSGTVTTTGSTDDSQTVTETGKTDRDSTVTQTSDSKLSIDEKKSLHSKRLFLDTPQGILEIRDSKYITNITDTTDTTITEATHDTEGTVATNTDEDVSTQNSKQLTGGSTSNQQVTNSDVSETTSSTIYNGEHRATHDNNTRVEKVGDHVETSVYTKKGNIGIDTDSDMITKHINLQKVLRNIERMFFEECEDLFMLVYE